LIHFYKSLYLNTNDARDISMMEKRDTDPKVTAIGMNALSFSYASNSEELGGCPQCKEVLHRLYEDNKTLIQNIEYNQKASSQVKQLYEISAMGLSLRRIPALVVTLVLEIFGGIIINQLHEVIQSLTLIVSFMPAISALSGNLGLQASSNTIRGLGAGLITPKTYRQNILKEIKSGLLSASIVALVMASIGVVWAHFDNSNFPNKPQRYQVQSETMYNDDNSSSKVTFHANSLFNDDVNSSSKVTFHNSSLLNDLNNSAYPPFTARKDDKNEHALLFGGVILVGTWISMMVSTVNGASTPILANMMSLDPAKVAGPLETAFQDIVGQSFLLGLSYLCFHYVEHIV